MAGTNNAINSTFPTSPISPANGGTGVVNPTAHALPVAEGSSNFTFLSLTNGQLLMGSTGADPVAANITAGTGIIITNAAGSIKIDATGNGGYLDVSGTTQLMSSNVEYTADNASLVTFTLPVTAAVGDYVIVNGKGAGGWIIDQNAGQVIHAGTQTTTTGTGGSIASSAQYDNVKLKCITANTTWTWQAPVGNLTIV